MYSLGEVNFIQGMHDLGNCKNSVGLKPNAELRKDAKAPSYNIGTELDQGRLSSKFVKRFSSYNALFDIEKSVIEGENCLFWNEIL
jgi:hypothetical protein